MVAAGPAVVAFLALLALAVQLLGGLYATSVVGAAAFDAARLAAADGGGPAAQGRAEAHLRDLLGDLAAAATVAWRYVDTDAGPGADAVELRVTAPSPVRPLPALDLPFDVVDRAVTVRLERRP